jgi:hypothetical protein
MPEVAHRTGHPSITPTTILPSQLEDPFFDLVARRAVLPGWPIPLAVELLGDQPAVPRKNGFGSNDLRDLSQRFPP